MTKHDQEQSENDRPALITPAMIDAGVRAFCDYQPDEGEPLSERVCEIFLAMMAEFPSGDRFHD